MKNIIVEVEKISNLHSGLGQFCNHLGKKLIAHCPNNLQLKWAVKRPDVKPLGENQEYHKLMAVDRYVPIKTGKHTIWHSIHQDSPYVPWKKGKFILTIHDLNFLEKYSNPFRVGYRKHLLQQKIDRADVITTISQFSADVIREQMHVGQKPIEVIYNGCIDPENRDGKSSIVPSSKFFFSIGVLQPRKNFQALFPFLKLMPDFQLIVSGADSNKYREQLKTDAASAGVLDRVIFTGSIDNATKHYLFQNCDAFLFPSLSEGFGLPVIEAMSYGKPVMLSNKTCLPEIGGDNAGYWEHFEPEYMAMQFNKYLLNFTSDMSTQAKERARAFSWDEAAEKYLTIYSEI